jgi:hypothetical protein
MNASIRGSMAASLGLLLLTLMAGLPRCVAAAAGQQRYTVQPCVTPQVGQIRITCSWRKKDADHQP